MTNVHSLTSKINRRGFMAATVSLPLASCATANALAAPVTCDRETLLRRYSAFLFMERRMLSVETGDPEEFIPADRRANRFHFPLDRDWHDVPQPSTRAALVLGTVGVELGAE